jgi:hypothetical protein
MDWIRGIDWKKPSWSDIARLLGASTIYHKDDRERAANYAWAIKIIKRHGPQHVYDNGRRFRSAWQRVELPRLKAKWAEQDREKLREMGRKGARSDGSDPPPKPPKPKKEWLTYSSSTPPKKGIIKKALWRKKRKKPPIETV